MTVSATSVMLLTSLIIAPGIVLAGGYLLMRWMREPAERIRVVCVSMAAALIAPILMLGSLTPTWELGWIDAAPQSSTDAGSAATPQRQDNGSRESIAAPLLFGYPINKTPRSPAPQPTEADDSQPLPLQATNHQPTATADVSHTARTPTTVDAESPPAGSIGAPVRLDRVMMLLAMAYGVVAGILIVRLLIGQWQLGRLIARAQPPTAEVIRQLQSITAAPDHVRVRISPDIDAPLIGRPLRPTVLLPHEMTLDSNRQQLQFGLTHELAHLRNRDLWTWSFVNLLQVLFAWHPCYWRLRSELRCSQDIIADAQTAVDHDDRPEYAETLLSIARLRRSSVACNALTMGDHRSNLYRRITMLVNCTSLPTAQCRRRVWLFVGLIGLLCVGVSTVRLGESTAAPLIGSPASPPVSALIDDDEEPEQESADKQAEKMEWQGKELSYTGQLTDKRTGEPIAGATVTIIRSILTSREHTALTETEHETNMNGEYSFVVEPEHTEHSALYIELKASHEDYASIGPMGYAMSMIRKNETLGSRPFFENVSLHPAEPVTGIIVGPDDQPLEGVDILGYSALDLDDFRDYGSFTRTETEADGSFRLNLIKEGSGIFWVLPKDYAISQHVVDLERGDLGTLKLEDGVRVSGQVLDARGNPVPDVYVNINNRGRDDSAPILNRVASSVRRGALTDSEGRFTLNPLPPGDYEIGPAEQSEEPGRTGRQARKKLPAVFVNQPLTLKAGVPSEPVTVQAIPHVLVRAQYFDSKGEKCRGHSCMIFGQLDGQSFFGQGRPDENGTISCPVPHGLENTQVTLMTNEHGVLRYRMGPEGELKQDSYIRIMLETLEDDTEEIQIIRYKAPIAVVNAVDEEGNQLEEFVVRGAYEWGQQPFILGNGANSDISFEKQKDGRHRSSQMLPDEKVTIYVDAEGFETGEVEINLAEGETKDVQVQLTKKADE